MLPKPTPSRRSMSEHPNGTSLRLLTAGFLAVTMAVAFGAGAARAQDPGQQDPQAPPVDLDQVDVPDLEGMTAEEEEALRLVEQILREQQLIVSGRDFVYRAEGRRDPFRSLLVLRTLRADVPGARPPGLPGFLVDEVEVIATAQYQGRWHAMLVGLDDRTYFVEVGQEFYDGRLIEIDENQVVFEQEVEDAMGARSTRPLVKRLDTETQE